MRRFLSAISFCFAITLVAGCCGSCANIQPGTLNSGIDIPKPQYFNYKRKNLDSHRAKLIKYISKRVVRVVCKKGLINTDTNTIVKNNVSCGWGSGTIIRSYSDHTFILTAYHVVNAAKKVGPYSNTEWFYYYMIETRNIKNEVLRTYGGTLLVAKDEPRDVAVLQIPYNLNIQTPISHDVILGQEAHVLGYPWITAVEGVHISYTHGYIGTMHMGNKNDTSSKQHDRIDIDIYFGNSGSAVFDNKGMIVGMINSMSGIRFFGVGFYPRPKQTFGCSARGILEFLDEARMVELTGF